MSGTSFAGGAPTTPTVLSSPSGKESSSIGVRLVVVPGNPAVNQQTTFAASASSSADATLDFGDGNQTAFKLTSASQTTLRHTYSRSGTFLATLTAINIEGVSASIQAPVVVPIDSPREISVSIRSFRAAVELTPCRSIPNWFDLGFGTWTRRARGCIRFYDRTSDDITLDEVE